jgi:hypothetical protein
MKESYSHTNNKPFFNLLNSLKNKKVNIIINNDIKLKILESDWNILVEEARKENITIDKKFENILKEFLNNNKEK